MTRVELIAALKAATGPNMTLSREIASHVGWVNRADVYRDPPDFTASLDAALTLMPKGYGAVCITINEAGGAGVVLAHPFDAGKTYSSAAIALCIAALKARGDA